MLSSEITLEKYVYVLLILCVLNWNVNGQIISQTDQHYTGNQPLAQDFQRGDSRGIGFSKRNDVVQYHPDVQRNSPSTFQTRTITDNLNSVLNDGTSLQRGTSLNRFNEDDIFRNHRTQDRMLADNSRNTNNKFSRQGTSIVFLTNRNNANSVSKNIVFKSGSGSSSRGLILKTGSGTKIHLNGGPSGRRIIIEQGSRNRNSRIHNNRRNSGLKTVDEFSGTKSNLEEGFSSHGRHTRFQNEGTLKNQIRAPSSAINSFISETGLQNDVSDKRRDSFYLEQPNTDTRRFPDHLRRGSTDTKTRFLDRLLSENRELGVQNLNPTAQENSKLSLRQQLVTDPNTDFHGQRFSDGISQNFKDARTDFLDGRFSDRLIQDLKDVTNSQTNFMDSQRSEIIDQQQADIYRYDSMSPTVQKNIRYSEIQGGDVKSPNARSFTDFNSQKDISKQTSKDLSVTQTQIEDLLHSGFPTVASQNRRKLADLIHGLIQTFKSNSNHQLRKETRPEVDQGVSANMPTVIDKHRQNADIKINAGPVVLQPGDTSIDQNISTASSTNINIEANKSPTAKENLISETKTSNSGILSQFAIVAKNEPMWKELEEFLAFRKFKLQQQENAKKFNKVKVKIGIKTNLPVEVPSNVNQPVLKDPNTNTIIPTAENTALQNSYMSDKHKNINNKISDKQLSISKTDIRTSTSGDPNHGHVMAAAGNYVNVSTAKPAMTHEHVITKVEAKPQQKTHSPEITTKPTTTPMYEIETEEPEAPEVR